MNTEKTAMNNPIYETLFFLRTNKRNIFIDEGLLDKPDDRMKYDFGESIESYVIGILVSSEYYKRGYYHLFDGSYEITDLKYDGDGVFVYSKPMGFKNDWIRSDVISIEGLDEFTTILYKYM